MNCVDRRIALKQRSNRSRTLRVFNYPLTRLPDCPIHESASGFTIIELLVVLALISILATMGMAQYRQGIVHAREAVLKTDSFDLRDAIDQYYADRGEYPSALESLVTDGYLRRIPEDPLTGSAETWQTELADLDPAFGQGDPARDESRARRNSRDGNGPAAISRGRRQ